MKNISIHKPYINMVIKISEEKTLTELLLEVLHEKRLTVREISELVGFSENSVRVIINQLKGKDIVQETGRFRSRFKVYELPNVLYDDNNTSINISLRHIDTEILKKMLLPFVKRDIVLKLTPEESDRITNLFTTTYDEEGERIDGK